MKALCTAFALIVSLLVVGNVLAAERRNADPGQPAGAAANPLMEMLSDLNLSVEQKAKIEKLNKEFGPKFKRVFARMQSVLTAEQKRARTEAVKAALAAGKRGNELKDAIHSAVTLSEAQEAKMAEAAKEMAELQKTLHAKTVGLLTPEQKEKLKKKLEDAKARQID
jgi:Spy/CpxP family protein refolding chaperone